MSVREITSHKINICNESLVVKAVDEVSKDGANHEYEVSLKSGKFHNFTYSADGNSLMIPFQKGPIGEVGVNGLTQEVLIAILIDRLESFQKGHYRCRENALAITKLEEALLWLNSRTNRRIKQGIEGTHELDKKEC